MSENTSDHGPPLIIWVIIPTYNEERALPRTLASVFQQKGSYQILVVDGGSTDRTREIACSHSDITWLTAPKGRASQMNTAANYVSTYPSASNDWLLFLHADTCLPLDAFTTLRTMASDTSCLAGGFQHRFSGDDWRLQLISWLDNFRCQRSRIIYGDQALFVRVSLFRRLDGFPEQPMLEDVRFGEKLLKHTQPRLIPSPVVTDARKFLQMGIWLSFFRVLMIILHVEYGLPTFTPSFFSDIR